MKCVEVYKKLYHQEPFDVAFCPYRISPLGAHIDISMEKSMDWQSIRAFTWPTTRNRTALWNCSR